MYKNVLQNIDHIAIWPVISFLIFFLFFLILIWWVVTVNRDFLKKMGEMPLQDGVNINESAHFNAYKK